MKLSNMVRGYLECALWSSNDNADDSGGEPLDANYCLADFADEAVKEAKEVCRDFLERCGEERFLLSKHETHKNYRQVTVLPDSFEWGWNLWLTSVGHGAGFWDGAWENGDALTVEAREAGLHIQGVYIGDNNKLYFHG